MSKSDESRNPYIDSGKMPQLRLSVVAFVDILGYQDIVCEAEEADKGQELLEQLHSALSTSFSFIQNEGSSIRYMFDKDIYKVRTFTDNIVIGHPVLDDAESELGSILSHLGLFQLTMINAGFPVRGAISIGKLYMDNVMVYGQGLVDAYRAERELARDPRIILAESTRVAVIKHLEYYGLKQSAPQVRDIYKDSDGQFYLNYLESILIAEDEEGPYYEGIENHKKVVEAGLSYFQNKPTVWSKYAWVANYHNYFCDQYPYFKDEHKIDLSGYQMQPTRIIE